MLLQLLLIAMASSAASGVSCLPGTPYRALVSATQPDSGDARLREVQRTVPDLESRTVVVQVWATAVNRVDLYDRRRKADQDWVPVRVASVRHAAEAACVRSASKSPMPFRLQGMECSGRVVARANDTSVQLGAPVMALLFGGGPLRGMAEILAPALPILPEAPGQSSTRSSASACAPQATVNAPSSTSAC